MSLFFFKNEPTSRAVVRLSALYATATSPVIASSLWQMVGATFESAAAVIKLWYGTEASPAAEPTYAGGATVGAGAVTSEAADDFQIGNRAGLAQAFQGVISCCCVVARQLVQEEVQDWQYNPRVIPVTRGFWRLGNLTPSGLQLDESGYSNHGTVSGAVWDARGPVTRRPFSQGWRFPKAAAAAPGTGTPILQGGILRSPIIAGAA